MDQIEKRSFTAELRADSQEEKAPCIVGYAALYESLSEDLGGFRENILPGAFTHALESCDCRALIDHDSTRILGRSKAGTLRLFEDKKGLRVEIDPPDTTYARDLLTSMRRGDVTQMSFGFMMGEHNFRNEDGQTIRDIVDIQSLLDVSVVTFPAFSDTTCAVRSLEQWKRSQQLGKIPNLSRVKNQLTLIELNIR